MTVLPLTTASDEAFEGCIQPAYAKNSDDKGLHKIFVSAPPTRVRHRIVPIFLPFAGCPFRCLFCAQDKQTGLSGTEFDCSTGNTPQNNTVAPWLCNILERLEAQLAEIAHTNTAQNNPRHGLVDIAFYGGTFTLLPKAAQQACMAVAARWKAQGLVRNVRCSTRPDAVEPEGLSRLRAQGLDMVELGVQSFSDAALNTSRRGYTGEQAREGCRKVHEAGLQLGIQLLPGLPGGTPNLFLADVAQSLALNPACMRFYPCLVLEGTGLAELWRSGHYAPWSVETTVDTLAQGLTMAWAQQVPVIRLSLAPEPELERNILAGPRHPALGNMIQAEAFWQRLSPEIAKLPRTGDTRWRLHLPHRCQGLFFGHGKSLWPRWQTLGVADVCWSHDECITLEHI